MLIRILHITLIFSLLTSSVGVVINQHFCRDELKSIALFSPAKSCHAPSKEKPATCPFHQQSQAKNGLDKQDCCKDSSDYLHSDHEQQMEGGDLPVWTVAFASPIFLSGSSHSKLTSDRLCGKFYRPPPLQTDPATLFQVFRL